MLRFDLKSLLSDYESRTGLRLSYDDLSRVTSVSVDTLKSLATRENYNATLGTLERISIALGANPIQYLAWRADQVDDGTKADR
ncbi:MAG: helix-turn-helix domain-containing protein [Bdellovibrionota bacterium]